VFIELTDHLRCPADHEERYLVLLPGEMSARSVLTGDLGCPVCGRMYRVVNGIVDFGGGSADEPPQSALDADAVLALSGLSGGGGYLALVGGVARNHAELAESLAGVGLVGINPPRVLEDSPGFSILRGATIPLKSSSMRGVVLGPGFGSDPHWIREALRVTLPGLRVVGEGRDPELDDLELLASAGGCWVASKVRNRG
jgi:uncharacterized protein YbaR (Trm112 family)